MPVFDQLTTEQKIPASHDQGHARLLAGPGTGKTFVLTGHVSNLVSQQGIDPESILTLTFTREAARELRQRIDSELGSAVLGRPSVMTLHSYALSCLLRNPQLQSLFSPLRIASGWEFRQIILEDMKRRIERPIAEIRELFAWLQTDWNTLAADEGNQLQRSPDPQFIGAWQEHRKVFRYTLLDELVYQFKRALDQNPSLDIQGPWEHLLVDEYQDLNQCDIATIRHIVDRNSTLFCAGDDDQSIYAFRHAYPAGIRVFSEHYPDSSTYNLITCMRCRSDIIKLAEFVAKQDAGRIQKPDLVSSDTSHPGIVKLLRFSDNYEESSNIAIICGNLIQQFSVDPKDLLILLRSDRNRTQSNPIVEALTAAGIAVASDDSDSLLPNGERWEEAWAALRLVRDRSDALAWRTLLQIRPNGVGSGTSGAIADLARDQGLTFTAVLEKISNGELSLSNGAVVSGVYADLNQTLGFWDGGSQFDQQTLRQWLEGFLTQTGETADVVTWLVTEPFNVENQPDSMDELVEQVESRIVDSMLSSEVEVTGVRVMTMHKAKGLTATAVIVSGVEDEVLPFSVGSPQLIDDERRLLYVSLTRARHILLMSYCNRRLGTQNYSGRNSGQPDRNLTRFLQHGPIAIDDGRSFARDMNDLSSEYLTSVSSG